MLLAMNARATAENGEPVRTVIASAFIRSLTGRREKSPGSPPCDLRASEWLYSDEPSIAPAV